MLFISNKGRGPGVVVKAACLRKSEIAGSSPALIFKFQRNKMFIPCSLGKIEYYEDPACSATDHQGSNFASCVWRAVSLQSPHHPQEDLLAQFIMYVHKGGPKPH